MKNKVNKARISGILICTTVLVQITEAGSRSGGYSSGYSSGSSRSSSWGSSSSSSSRSSSWGSSSSSGSSRSSSWGSSSGSSSSSSSGRSYGSSNYSYGSSSYGSSSPSRSSSSGSSSSYRSSSGSSSSSWSPSSIGSRLMSIFSSKPSGSTSGSTARSGKYNNESNLGGQASRSSGWSVGESKTTTTPRFESPRPSAPSSADGKSTATSSQLTNAAKAGAVGVAVGAAATYASGSTQVEPKTVTSVAPHSDQKLAAEGYKQSTTIGKTDSGESFKQAKVLDGKGQVASEHFEKASARGTLTRDSVRDAQTGEQMRTTRFAALNGESNKVVEKLDASGKVISRAKEVRDSGNNIVGQSQATFKNGQMVQQTIQQALPNGKSLKTDFNIDTSSGNKYWTTQLPKGQYRVTEKQNDGTVLNSLRSPQGKLLDQRITYASGTKDFVAADGSKKRVYADGNVMRWNANGQKVYDSNSNGGGFVQRRYQGSTVVNNYYNYHAPRGGYYPFYVWSYHPWYPTYWGYVWNPMPFPYPVATWCNLFVCGPTPFGFWPAVYHSPIFWMRDWVLASMILEQRNAQIAAAQASSQASEQANINLNELIAASVRQEIQMQVQQDLREMQAQATDAVQPFVAAKQQQDPLEALFNNKGRLFFVQQSMYVVDRNAEACTLQKGDILKVLKKPELARASDNLNTENNQSAQDDDAAINMKDVAVQVVIYRARKTVDACKAGHVVQVDLGDLLEMDNEFKRAIQEGVIRQKEIMKL